MRIFQSRQRQRDLQGPRRITLAESVTAEVDDTPVPVGTKVRLWLVDEAGKTILGKFDWRVAEVTRGNHDRPCVYRLKCGVGKITATRGQFDVVGNETP